MIRLNSNTNSEPCRLSLARLTHPPAFTLVELLVVIAIIAVLLAVLFPFLRSALRAARETTCAQNLQSWGKAFYMYSSDNYGMLPHTDDHSRDRSPYSLQRPDPRHPEHNCCYIDLLPPLLGAPAWRTFPNGQKPTSGIWQCPLAQPMDDQAYSGSYRPSQVGYHSYAMNSYLECDFDFGRPAGVPPYPSFLNLALCVAPGKTLLMFEQTLIPGEGYGQTGGGRSYAAGYYTAEDARALAERHPHQQGGLGSNVLFLDGHREWRNDLWDRTLNNPEIPKPGDRTWWPY